ncbi:MAG: LOG family protein [Acidobacteria bacterium]|uniref:LOG family protein n=1 Tax=Candidatus Polarisedimenticola svalbardensis TaxID=2886004 RepID=A0A8J6XTL6_9BACT|nr:LOG family protein [Candidatus Polarisedimenticola svalbardensis]
MAGSRKVAVFGSSEPPPGSPLYEEARETGRLLAGAGYTVLTGGYGGVMEGASRGADEAGGRTVGVLCDVFSRRSANRYVQQAVQTPDLLERTRVLIETASAYIILHGKAGTLAELTFTWALHRAGCLPDRPVILLGDGWSRFLDTLSATGMLDTAQRKVTTVAASPLEAVQTVGQLLEG